MEQSIDLCNFTAGELSPRLFGRTDIAKYYNGAAALRNMVVMPQGGATRRPGTAFAALNAAQGSPCRLIPFVFNSLQSYVIELGDGVARFFQDGGPILLGGQPVQIVTPYAAAELAAVGFTQSYDTLYLTHPNHPLQLLTRMSSTSWAINPVQFTDGPYLSENTTTTTLKCMGIPNANAGQTVTLQASNTAGINGGNGFQASDVGRSVRLRQAGVWTWLVISAVTDTLHVQAVVQPTVNFGAFGAVDGAGWLASTNYPTGFYVANSGSFYRAVTGGISAQSGGPSGTDPGTPVPDGTVTWVYTTAYTFQSTTWRLGKWYMSGDYPFKVSFFQNRLILAGTNNEQSIVECSVSGDFYNFAPTQADSTTTDANALEWNISDDRADAIRWLSPAGSAQAMALGIGTAGAEHVLQQATTASALSPTNVQVYQETTLGSQATARPQRIGKSVLFWNRPGLKLHEWTFTWQVNGYVGPELQTLSEHLPVPGVVDTAYQQNPFGVLWCIRSDGGLIGVTYLREQDVVGFHSHQLGGDYYGAAPVVEAIACVPSQNGLYDELWLSVLRTIAGVQTRTIEVMQPYFLNAPAEQAFYVDCGLSNALNAPAGGATIAGLTTTAAAGMAASFTGDGQVVLNGTTLSAGNVGWTIRMNGGSLLIMGVPNSTVANVLALTPLSSLAPAASGAWTLSPPLTTVSGLDVLNGETVALQGDGQDLGTSVVSAGAAALSAAATSVTAGLPYTSLIIGMPFSAAGAAAIATAGRIKRIDALYLRLHESAGMDFGLRTTDSFTKQVIDRWEPSPVRGAGDPMSEPVPLFSGIRRLRPSGGFDQEGQVILRQSGPLPLTVLSVGVHADVTEAG